AMIADAVHSISDFATDVIVVAFVRVSYKESDTDHRYGHGKFETFAAMLISMALLFVGLGIFLSGAKSIYNSFFSGMPLEKPSLIALFAAVASIVLKEWLFQYTIGVGKSIDNQAVIANAWHHRSDALSSIGAMLGIGGAIFFGDQWRILDPLAGMVVSVLIAWVAIKMGIPTVKELTESALPEEIENEIIDIFRKHDVNAVVVGEVLEEKVFRVEHKGKVWAEIPVDALDKDAPVYYLPKREPEYFRTFQAKKPEVPAVRDHSETLKRLLAQPTIASKAWVYEQFDSEANGRTLVGPGHGAAVVKIPDRQKAIAITTDANARYIYLDPKTGGKIAVAEAARNIVASGGEPIAVTDCLNFGSPEKPEIFWQLEQSVEGMSEACRALNT
ncbi:MAG: cation diffusion facilitator family transporter, partial [Bacillales bacterium]